MNVTQILNKTRQRYWMVHLISSCCVPVNFKSQLKYRTSAFASWSNDLLDLKLSSPNQLNSIIIWSRACFWNKVYILIVAKYNVIWTDLVCIRFQIRSWTLSNIGQSSQSYPLPLNTQYMVPMHHWINKNNFLSDIIYHN